MKIISVLTFLILFSLNAMQESVLNGIDVLTQQNYAPLQGHTVGLITNQTGHDRMRNSTIDLLYKAPGIILKTLFSPEHGIRGVLDGDVRHSTDEKTGLPIYSLHDGTSYKPRPEYLEGLTALVFDIQDIGCRFYTYISTLGHCLEAAAQAKIKFFVLDRVNPINGITVEGPILADGPSFVGYHTIAIRHGMTVGELALMFNKEKNFHADLTIIPVAGWKRDYWFDQTGLGWTNPSPNMRNLTQATLYPGVGLIELAPLSVGRGTDTPFEVIGAPYINEFDLAKELQKAQLAGVTFVPVQFTPRASKFQNELCKGVHIIVLNRDTFKALDLGITLARTLYKLYPEQFTLTQVNNLLKHSATLQAVKEQRSLEEIKRLWVADLEKFYKRRTQYLLYQ